jgi:hypothetical protein
MSELGLLGAIVFVLALILISLAESESMREYAERHAINTMADRSRRKKPQSMRPRCKYSKAGIQK